MSLRVWLPLDGNLQNLGCSNYTISVFRGTETYDNAGKIGKCFYAHGTNALKIQNILPDIYNYSAYSLCAWCYIESQNTTHPGSGIISGGNWNSQLLNLAMSNWSSDHYTKLRISGTNWNRTYNYDFYKDTWYHIVVCDDGTHTYAYVNGNLIGDTAASFLPTSIEGSDICIGGATYYSGMQFFGKINDVRIYDHCLSTAEVHEISQGLILHYKLSDTLNSNLLPATAQDAAAWIGSGATKTTDIGAIKFSPTGGERRIYINVNNVWTTSQGKYTVSLDAKADTNGHILQASRSIADYAPNMTLTTEWNHYSGVITLTGTSTSGTLSLQGPVGSTIWVRNVKVERGEVATPFNLNGDTIIIEDSSGYGHTGIVTGNLSSNTNTARYDNSIYMSNGQTDYITTQDNVGYFTNAITMNIWFKSANKSPGSSYHHCFNSLTSWTYIEMAVHSSGYLRCGLYINGTRYVANTNNTNLLDGNWHMLTMTYDGANVKRYVDGILKSTQAATGNLNTSSDKFIFGHGASTGYYCKEVYLSDARLYVTALSNDEVLSLYHTSAKVDNKQNLHAFELVENNSKIQINKCGQILCNELEEDVTTKFYKTDRIIETNEIIEF